MGFFIGGERLGWMCCDWWIEVWGGILWCRWIGGRFESNGWVIIGWYC